MKSVSPLMGLATLSRKAFAGEDLSGLLDEMLDRVERDPTDANTLMDLSIVLQLLDKPRMALTLQERALALSRVYHLPPKVGPIELRLLAVMAPGNLMANTPLAFILEGSTISLTMVYATENCPLPEPLPEHDVVFVAVADSDANVRILTQIRPQLEAMSRPVVNMPDVIGRTLREHIWEAVQGVKDAEMPLQLRVSRELLSEISVSGRLPIAIQDAGGFPITVRPTGSHAGQGLSLIGDHASLRGYLDQRSETEFYLSQFVDYRSDDAMYRKYRIAVIDGVPFASHMAISENWMVHYLSAGMSENAQKRQEEERFMVDFDRDFGARHGDALKEISRRVGADYLVFDCGETKHGKLLVFEADAGAVVHAMDPVEIFPYKHTQMKKVFSAFHRMLAARSGIALSGGQE